MKGKRERKKNAVNESNSTIKRNEKYIEIYQIDLFPDVSAEQVQMISNMRQRTVVLLEGGNQHHQPIRIGMICMIHLFGSSIFFFLLKMKKARNTAIPFR